MMPKSLRPLSFLLAALALLWAPMLAAEERIALIVTNQNYSLKEQRLVNPHADGKLMKEALEAVGFKVWHARDTASRAELEKVIGEHVARLADAGPDAIGFFYYSGHGAADGPQGRNFLIPTETNITYAAQLRLSAMSVDQITDALAGAGGKMSFAVFDACRNVPLQRAEKSTFKGFSAHREELGMLIAYATEPGNVAVDESLYARILAEEIVKQGVEAGSVFRAVRRRVGAATEQRQRPEYSDKRSDDFIFRPAPPQVAVGKFAERLSQVCEGVEVSLSSGGKKCIEPGSGATFRDCWTEGGMSICGPQMTVLPAGKFLQGSPEDEPGRFPTEGPRREVTIGLAFAVGRTHVTRAEFAAFVAATGYKPDIGCYTGGDELWLFVPGFSWQSPGFDQTDDHPVVCLSLWDAQAYAQWLSAGTGKSYRLLSETEAEYAARGVTKPDPRQPRYFFGNEEKALCAHANGADETDEKKRPGFLGFASCKDNYLYTAPVASFKANAFGLFDVHGNVSSWTQDCGDAKSIVPPGDDKPILSGLYCRSRVVRGGSWTSLLTDLRAAARQAKRPDYRSNDVGFRLARTLDP